jgi:hypothetical protein
VGARRLGQDEQYLTVREILSEASTLADGALSRERSDFYRFGYVTLGLRVDRRDGSQERTLAVRILQRCKGGSLWIIWSSQDSNFKPYQKKFSNFGAKNWIRSKSPIIATPLCDFANGLLGCSSI